MRCISFFILFFLQHLSSSSCEELGRVFLVLEREGDESQNTGTFFLEDNYCLDPTLPRTTSACRIRVLATQSSIYSQSRISEMSLDFHHPSRPNTVCYVRWPWRQDVRVWCQPSPQGTVRRRRLPPFWTETTTTGEITHYGLLNPESRCEDGVTSIRYYRDGVNGVSERRPSVVFRTRNQGCAAGIAVGRRVNNFRTTEAPCVYNGRRRCRPLTKEQYDSLIRDIESSDLYVDFRTTSRPP